jgi:membrane-bound serine protease (ClpP class)
MREDLVGRDGVAMTDLRPSGTALVGEERVDVVTEGEFISQGSPLRVLRSEGYRLVVRAA